MSKKDLGKKRICPTTGKTFYDLNKDPIVSPYTGELLNVVTLQDSKKDEVEAIKDNEINSNDKNVNHENNIEEDNEEGEDAVIPEIDEDNIPDLENSSDDEIVEDEIDEELVEFEEEEIDELDEDEDEGEFIEDDVSDVIKSVPTEEDN